MTHPPSGVPGHTATNMNQDEEQNTNIAVLIERFKNFENNFEKRFKDLSVKVDSFDKKLGDVVRSFNDDKKHSKFYMDEKFYTKDDMKLFKKEAEPVMTLFMKTKNKLATIGVAVVIFLMLAGAASLGAVNFIKAKIINILH